MFFDAFPRFYETSETSAHRGRLNLRYEAIFAANRDVFAGTRVLDIASHDGRWSLAALKTGAAQVIGIEARGELVRAAEENLALYAGGDGGHTFIEGDIFEVLARQKLAVDVVLCLGFLDHTLRYNELMSRIREIGPSYLIIDTKVVPRARKPVVQLRINEAAARQAAAVADSYSYDNRTLVGKPSLSALKLIVETYGFEIEGFSDWDSLIQDYPGTSHVGDYATGQRVTARCVSKV
jgi:predicted nicotinamide N-methyase